MRNQRMLMAVLAGGLLLASAGHGFAQPADSRASSSEAVSSAKDKDVPEQSEALKHSAMVQKLGSMMGMSTEKAGAVFEVANFAVLALLVGWALLKMLPKTFRDRNSAIQKDLVDARTATEEASARLGSVEERLAKLDEQIAGMKAQAEKDAALEEARTKASVEEEKKKILAAAEQEIQSATVHARREIQKFAAELAIEQAARKLVVSAETDRLLVQNFARRLGGDDSKEGQN